jgi:gluconate 2-dehydrogenase gamma chain
MIGFPGAYGAYYDMVDRFGVRFDHPPRSLAEARTGEVHVDPNIPATAPAPARSHKGHA